MEPLVWFALALVVVFLINLVPAFMPSSWMVLAFFAIKFDLPLIPLGVSGAFVSGLGRACLAVGSDLMTRTFFKAKAKELDTLGGYLREHKKTLPAIVFAYALTPLPTNNLFVAAGMVSANLPRVLVGFWAARMPADVFWMWVSHKTFANFGDVFKSQGNLIAILLQVGALLSVVLLYALPWERWANSFLSRHGATKGQHGKPGDRREPATSRRAPAAAEPPPRS